LIANVILENVEVSYPGGGNPLFAKVGLNSLDEVPERPTAYPDFSMFRELPAWGMYIRHARNIECKELSLSAEKKDYRTAIVLDDVHMSRFVATHIKEPEKKAAFYQYRSSEITEVGQAAVGQAPKSEGRRRSDGEGRQ